MTERLIGETGSRKRRRFLLLPVLLVAFISLFVIAGAQAVHDGGGFELDRNATSSAAVPGEDWGCCQRRYGLGECVVVPA